LQLLRGGLLSAKKQQGMQRQLLRSYFPFYAQHPERSDFQEQLTLALRSGVRPDEAYDVLKSYVLNQKNLTLDTANLAEELLDHRPQDETLAAFFVEHFLKEKKTHYRAEYFYAKYLAKDGPLTEEILALCLSKILQHPRRDDFSGWCLVRAFDRQSPRDSRVRQAVHDCAGNLSEAARRLGISRNTLYRKMAELGLRQR
jgi:transcriptional regulator of acetoin/glycerol metabolism